MKAITYSNVENCDATSVFNECVTEQANILFRPRQKNCSTQFLFIVPLTPFPLGNFQPCDRLGLTTGQG